MSATQQRAAVVSLDDVTKGYPGTDTKAVDRVSLDIREGEFFSLLGPSGSGKTSTLRMIAGFEEPTQGRVLLDGLDVSGLPPYHRDVNTVFQNYALFPHMTIQRNVEFPMRMKGVPSREAGARSTEALESVEMAEYGGRLPHQLSGGQRQRVALARALVGRPRVLLLDEPLGALDLRLRQQMQLVLKRLQREVGISFVYVTHDQGEALSMSDRIAVMNKGRVEQLGSPAEIYHRPSTRFVASFIGRSNLLPCAVEALGDSSLAHCGDGITVMLPAGTPAGQALLSVRYESVALTEGGASGGFPVTVDEVVFLGDAVEIIGRTGATVLVARTGGQRGLRVQRGDSVEFAIHPTGAVILRD
ncbi:ABC transporter ATP-binding protein [Kineosporia sp. A_224]|uniref:ABC transporter ATP-binding protein n=1 Tax=Kineosporia sp. A_224 TaxID=1962180 RepID=UPI000B4BD897|nr:ABC transporter ATP-binding protein [Kineosporia sp. A_224]